MRLLGYAVPAALLTMTYFIRVHAWYETRILAPKPIWVRTIVATEGHCCYNNNH